MATTQKIEIPISLSAQIENLKDIRQTLTATLNSAGKDSSLAKTLTKDLSKINQMLGQVEDFALSPTIDESGLKQLQKVLDNFYKQAQSSFSNADFANFEAIASENDIARLKALTAEAAKYRRELETLRKSGSSERTDAYLLRAGKQDLLGKAQAQKGFDSTASLGKNALAMERAAESYQRSADAMQTAIEKLESEANAAIANAQQAAQQVKTLEQQKQTLGADTQAARFHHAAGRFKTAIVANRGVENPTISSVERGLRSALESVQANGKIATDARNAVGDWIKHLFPQLPTSDIASMVGQDINTLLSDLMERIFGSGYLDTDVIYSPEHSAILSRAQDYSRSEINRIAGVHSTANVLDLTARSQQVDSDWRKAKSRWTAYNNEADSKVTSWLEMTDQQEELTAAAQATAQLSQELYTLADAAQKAAIASKEAQIQQNAEAQQDLKEGATRPTRQLAQQGKTASRQYQADDASFLGEVNENLKGAKIDANEAEQFTNNLKQSITHWMSAQQIINLVKDGIRQAYQDIKSLDAAMTNIAVVTDMSVSDLWGKINEYMSIAQQYGVTTQGVYEVSQLYYQQGLSTNEVMAATTETLKMARIAGMGYAEAADAMTVAIRSFKMEMSDAGHVTDVYSKVAAITASDSEELAIAMSKTASSAESVGSSFENTTAMLAVMVETTRESAQNLGSALKSIISRYGEMKSGMTQDSDGEIIDYNKTDAALRSVGISLKDAQGQFRDFDDVIFELSAKWDSLDKNTQRYIATIMAGNRQQSRFIALVDNWERLEEVTGAAQDSEDAGLLQYAKTLDSLDTKLNNLKTSFQSFYMSIFNGEFFKGFIDIITNVVDNLSKVGPLLGSINLLQLINQIKLVGQLLLNAFSKNIGKIQQSSKEWQKSFTNGWPSVGERIADAISKAIVAKAVPTGKQFAEGVVQGAQGGQGQPQNVVPQKNQAQTIKIKDKYRGQAQSYLKQIGLDFSVGNLFDQNGKLTKNASREFLSPKKNSKVSSFENLTQSYQKQADIILKASDQFDKAAVNWANKVKAAGNGFEAKIGAAGKKAYLTALQAADAEAEIELAAAKQAAAEQKKADTKQKLGQGLVMAGTALSSAGMMIDQSTMAGYDKSTWLQGGGAAFSTLGQWLTGNYVGAAITAISGIATTIQRVSQRAKIELENAKKAAEEANVERAESKEKYTTLNGYVKKLKEAEAARYDSNEAEQEWLALNNEIAEQYPELISFIDSEGNAIVNLTGDYEGLSQARIEAAEATALYYREQARVYQLQRQNAMNETKGNDITSVIGSILPQSVFFMADGSQSRINVDAHARAAYQGIFGTNDIAKQTQAADIFNANTNNVTDDFILDAFGLTNEQLWQILMENDSAYAKEWFDNPNWIKAYGISNISGKEIINVINGLKELGYSPIYGSGNDSTFGQASLINPMSILFGQNMSLEDVQTAIDDYRERGILALTERGVSLYDLVTKANSEDSGVANIARYFGEKAGVLVHNESDDSYGLTSDEEAITRWRNAEKNPLLEQTNLRNWASAEGNIYLYGTAAQEALTNINGYEEILLNRAIELAGGADKLASFIQSGAIVGGETITLEDVYTEYANRLATWYTGLSDSKKELFQSILSQSTSFSYQDIQTNLKSLGLSEEENPELYRNIIQTWYTDNYNAQYRAMMAIWDSSTLFKNLSGESLASSDKPKDFTAWKKTKAGELAFGEGADAENFDYETLVTNGTMSAEEAYRKYLEASVQALKLGNGLEAIILKSSTKDLEAFTAFSDAQDELISKATGKSKVMLEGRLNTLTAGWSSLISGEGKVFGIDITKLTDAQESAFKEILLTDVGSNAWLDNIKSFAVQAGQSQFLEMDKLKDYLYTSFNTEVSLLAEGTKTFLSELESLSKSQTSGFSYEESVKLFNQMKKIKPDVKWSDLFKENEKGLIVLQNFDTTFNDIYQNRISSYKTLNDQIGTLLSGLNSETGASGLNSLIKMLKKLEEKTDLEIDYGSNIKAWTRSQGLELDLNEGQWKELGTIVSSADDPVEALRNYLIGIQGTINLSTEYLTNLTSQIMSEQGFAQAFSIEATNKAQESLLSDNGTYENLKTLWTQKIKKDNEDTFSTWDSEQWKDQYNTLKQDLSGATIDGFGNLIITNYEKFAEYLAKLEGDENAKPSQALLNKAKAAQISAQETVIENLQSGIEGLYTSFIEDGEIEFSEVKNILTTLQPRITDSSYAKLLQLYEQAKSGTAEDFKTFIDELANLARVAGYNISEDEITAKIQDAYTSLVKTLFDSLSNAIKGSLTADDLGSLETSLGLDLSAYQQQTLDGYQLSSEGLLKVAGELEHRYGNVAGYAEKMAELFVGKDKLYSGREELEARIAEIEKARDSEEKVSKELEYQLSLLKKMAATSRLNKDDPLFNFMNQDSTKGFAAGADEMVASIDKVKSTFKSITQKQKVDVDDFYNMMDFMYKNRTDKTVTDKDWISSALGITDAQLTKFKTKSNETINTYEGFVNAIVSGSKELGKVDSKVLLDMGISMDTMSSSMAGSLQTVATEQIDFLSKMRKTLEALQALDNIEDISIGLGFTASDGTEVTLANFDKYYLEFDQSKLEAEIKDLIQTVDETFTAAGYDFDYKTLFGANGFSLQDEADIAVAKGLGQFINFYKTATETELTNFAQQYPDIFKEDSIDWAKLKDIFATGIDWNSFASSLTADLQASIQAALANVPGITVEGLNIKWDETKAGANLEDAKAKIINAYKSQGKDIELELGKDNIFTVHIIPSNVKAIVDKAPEAWTYDFANKNYTRDLEVTTEAGTVDVQVVIDNLGNVTFTGKDGAKLDEATIKAAAESAGIYSMTGLELQADGTATANVNITASESTAATVSTIAADVSKIVELLSAGITISVDSEAANQALVTIQEAYNALKENIANNPIKISLEYDTPPELNLPPITRIVKLEYNNNSSNSSTDGESGAGGATGNFKAVAMTKAKGNVSALLNGAALAQGTLMGELGPELYVQGGQYQIAGANGPEFVDLAPDAIVFNHLQTANLLGKGHTTKTGSPITSERRAVGAYATGNVSGLAFANGSIGSAIAAIDRAISIWQNIANITAADLVGGGGGGGGGGNSIKAVTEELTKWYNLTRQIEKLEQDINNLLAERKNITDGGEYLRSLREQQQLLAQQAATQQTLLAYQEEQLGRQQEHIKNNKIWSQFLTFDESGNLQYITGNESNGGQGQLSVLEQLNKMSGEEQLNYIKNTLGYSYTDQDGKTLDGQDLVTQFFKELQEQIDSYDSLYDTVHSTEEQLQKIQTSISEIDAEIEKNQMDLEKAIYDIILDSWKKQIEQMEDQKKLAQEANEAYIENLNKALSDEREMYSQNESIADRESLQNRLALLRRSGGSASEIYDLEQQLDSMLKDEYFNKQEKMIENIEEASKEQIKKLEEQIKLEEEALEYQKENGVLWTQVYEIMQGTEESILAFMQGKAPEFFSQSTLQQKQMLTDWAKQIGIYTEDQQYKNYRKEAEDTHWDKNSWRAKISEGGVGRELAAIFDGLNADQQGTLKNLFTSTYANKMLESGDEKEALKAAIAALKAQLKSIKSQQASAAAAASGGSGGNDSGGTGQNPSSGQKPKRYRVDYTVVFVDNQTKTGYGVGSSAFEALAAAKRWAGKHTKSPTNDLYPGKAPVRNTVYSKAYAYKQGGLVDYTGPALVHGTPSKPEAFLNAKQTAMISEAVKTAGDGGALNGIKATLAALNSTIKGIVNNDNSLTSSFTVAPGAVTIQVAQLNDSYDVEELSKDVMNRMVAIASRTTNRGVNRR